MHLPIVLHVLTSSTLHPIALPTGQMKSSVINSSMNQKVKVGITKSKAFFSAQKIPLSKTVKEVPKDKCRFKAI